LLKSIFRVCVVWLLIVTTLALTVAQTYTPKAGETVLKIAVEGRGDIFVKLHTKAAPKTTAHILKLVKSGFYDGLRFHRVERSPKPYLAQVGDPASKTDIDSANIGSGGSGAKVPFEHTDFPNVAGAVGLAHSVDDRESGDSQFYMLLSPAKFLDGNYTVFGQVVSGMEVLQKISRGDRIAAITVLG
jgi:cyclophilin family peptidyl-prolyl cis-trans isomerase